MTYFFAEPFCNECMTAAKPREERTMREIVGVIGAGALGTLVAASLARACDVRLLVRDPNVERAIAIHGGVRIVGEAIQDVAVTRDPEALRDASVSIIAVKTYATIDALRPLRDVVPRDATILSLQNGVEAAAQIASTLGSHRRIALGPTTEAATWLDAGIVRRMALGTTHIGWADGYDTGDDLAAIAALFVRCGLDARIVRPIEPYAWAKLVVNAAINPVTAIARVSNGTILERPDLRARAAALACEAYVVARASGIALPFEDPVAEAERVMALTAPNRSSMLQDFERGRPTENDAISGSILRRASSAGIAVPHTRDVYDYIASRERTARA